MPSARNDMQAALTRLRARNAEETTVLRAAEALLEDHEQLELLR